MLLFDDPVFNFLKLLQTTRFFFDFVRFWTLNPADWFIFEMRITQKFGPVIPFVFIFMQSFINGPLLTGLRWNYSHYIFFLKRTLNINHIDCLIIKFDLVYNAYLRHWTQIVVHCTYVQIRFITLLIDIFFILRRLFAIIMFLLKLRKLIIY